MAEQDPKEPILDTPELILKDAVLRSRKLDAEAEEALSQKDAAMCRQKLAERAELIAGLPARIRETMVMGQSFPKGEFNQLEILSGIANKALKDGHPFALSAFLTPPGQLEGQPDLLEEIVNELYPPKTEVIK